ncbi:ribonuclease H2 subunit C [Prorops nasuta]|uniref:ribonuclease H2 subunit C n=1 Tax=Prorops nasuta TaxID=863751 RepID=UPI0034CEAAF8
MSISLYLHQDVKNEDKSILHSMPCKIESDEPAKVSAYFEKYICNGREKNLDASFRGYPLKGYKVNVPSNYKGLTFLENKKTKIKFSGRALHCTGNFSNIVYWNYDQTPSKNDAFAAALDWIDIAEALHSSDD